MSVQLNNARDPSYFIFSNEKKTPPILLPEQNEKLQRLFVFLKNLNETTYYPFLKDLIEKCESSDNIPAYLATIKRLELSCCDLQTLPDEIAALSNLEELILIKNHLTQLPCNLNSLSHLRFVALQGNRFTQVPPVMCTIAQSRILNKEVFDLYLAENPMPTIPMKIKEVVRSMPHFSTIFVRQE
ncbi:MAG: hypothetical protein H0V82_03485 [Candidatus Protochlamydia sp.]|nr:hypothetical protein [Candidatus Protochlamydia sp.]